MQQRRSVPLERSCLACIRAKRRCDRQMPQCTRCSQRNKTCQYTNEPLAAPKIDTTARPPASPQTYNVESQPTSDEYATPTFSEQDSLHLQQRISNAAMMTRWASQGTVPQSNEEKRIQAQKAREWKSILLLEPSIKAVRISHTALTQAYLVNTLRYYPELYCSTGKTPFIHPLLSEMRLVSSPRAKEVFDACVSYHYVGNYAGLWDLKSAAQRLIESRPAEGGFEGLLSAVQALLLAEMALLFAPDAVSDDEAGLLLRTLSAWTKLLYSRVPQHLPASLTAWQAWTYAESVRRTILLAHILVDTFAAVRSGVFLHSVFLDALPFDSRTYLWDAETDPGRSLEGSPMISYKEFTEVWKAGLSGVVVMRSSHQMWQRRDRSPVDFGTRADVLQTVSMVTTIASNWHTSSKFCLCGDPQDHWADLG
ncbi:hypothetical protein NA57DRAFT_57622 [Rhizodiscina lignyota]|uniref:Zn(2)-C6 fungal-type domain-containing protein n=1 Tax=Rhizodiscina lignyota TaxID=1504668 RepID=A0A9P4ICU4_9PEZI|nr:hypothetical protein NA57DRAFT_57622 [Rhizodiscina lignyota]